MDNAEYWYNLWVGYSNDLSENQIKRRDLSSFKDKISFLEISDVLLGHIENAIAMYEGGAYIDSGGILGGNQLYDGLSLFNEINTIYDDLVETLNLEITNLKNEADNLYKKIDEAYCNYRRYYNSNSGSGLPTPESSYKIGSELADVDWNYYVP